MLFSSHLDAGVDYVYSLSSTQLYTLIVSLLVLITYSLLGSAPLLPPPPSHTLESSGGSPQRKMRRDLIGEEGPEPRWHYFRYVSLLVVGLFGASVLEFGLHARAYMRDSGRLLQFLVLWSVCLCYFFGFFGVSFVYNSDLGMEQETEVPLSQTHPEKDLFKTRFEEEAG